MSVFIMASPTAQSLERSLRDATKDLVEQRRDAKLGLRMNYDTAAVLDTMLDSMRSGLTTVQNGVPAQTIRFHFGSFGIFPSHDFDREAIRVFTIDDNPLTADIVGLPRISDLNLADQV